MTVTTTDLLLEATGVSKTYGAVVALKSASLAVRPGEVHALMGANGAGKSTLVKILTGAIHPDSGTIAVRGRERIVHSPGRGAPRRPRLRLPGAGAHPGPGHPRQPAPHRDAARAVPPLAARARPRGPRPVEPWRGACRWPRCGSSTSPARLAIEPDVLMLDEMTAALPANLTERVLEVVGRQRGGDRSVIFISHRMIEIAAVCDRATVLREGETVGVVDVTAGLRGADRRADARPDRRGHAGRRRPRPAAGARRGRDAARSRPAASALGTKLHDVSFDLYPGEVLGVVALEGQGQDELFDILAGLRAAQRRRARSSTASRSPSTTRPTPSGPASSTCRPTAPRRC